MLVPLVGTLPDVTASERVGRLSKFCNSERMFCKLRDKFRNYVAHSPNLAIPISWHVDFHNVFGPGDG
jgi:hypothetical protein